MATAEAPVTAEALATAEAPDTAAAPGLATTTDPVIVIVTMETITTADIQMIESIMIGHKGIAAVLVPPEAPVATKTIATSDHGIKAIGMCPHSIG